MSNSLLELIVASFLITLLVSVGYALSQPVYSRTFKKVRPGVIRYKDNSTLPVHKLMPPEKIIAGINKKAVLKSIKLLKYGEYFIREQKSDQSTEISPNRQVYEVVTEFTDVQTRVGNFDFATVTILIDAETGESFLVDFVGPETGFTSAFPGIKQENLPPKEQQRIKRQQSQN